MIIVLPDIELDSESFDDIFENAKNRIVSTYPEWTDLNYHDPGVTMLEMFAWLKEIQQYYLNKVGPENIRKYFKLLGIERGTKKPSKTQVRVTYPEDIIAAAGTRLYAGGICFEADEKTYISSARISCCISRNENGDRVVDRSALEFGGNLRIMPFPTGNSGEFYIGFDKPLKEGEQHRLYVDINDKDPVRRSPITDPDSFIPLADLNTEYYSADGWKKMDCTDSTFGFLTSGMMVMNPKGPHCKCRVGDCEAYFIRFRLSGGQYDIIPVIHSLEFRLLPVTQRDTRAEYFDFPAEKKLRLLTELSVTGVTRVYLRDKDGLFTPMNSFEKSIDEESGEVTVTLTELNGAESVRIVNLAQDFIPQSVIGFGLGLPFQEYETGSSRLEYESFAIMTELPASGGKFVEWKKVRDFSTAGPEDFVCLLDTSTGRLTFGNCIRGMAPEGRIFIIGCSETLGADGNVSVGRIDRMGDIDDGSIKITNFRRSEGGMNEETFEHCCVRAHLLLRSTETLVTDEDVESFVTGVQGLKIEKCTVVNDKERPKPVRQVIVKPWSPDGKGVPDERYKKNILTALEKRRMLGMGFSIVSPEYSGVRVLVSVTTDRSALNARERISAVISDFFAAYNNCFGAKLIYSRLYEMIDRMSFVVSVNALTLEIDGSGAQRTREGDLMLSPNVMAYPAEIELHINTR